MALQFKAPKQPEPLPKTGHSFWKTFFIVIGILASIVIIMVVGAIIALIIIKPYGIDVTKIPGAIQKIETQTSSSYDHPMLTTEQEIFLESVGVDVESMPTQITPEQEKCSVDALGEARVNDIKQGASPTINDYLKAKKCFE